MEALEGILQHRQGGGVGYKNQYSKIEIFHAFENQATQPFIDIRYLILNDGKQGGNLGAGLGYQFAKSNRVSLYTYFDLTESRTSYLFNQITTGLSYIHPLFFSGTNWGGMTIYLNGYFPLKSKETRIRPSSFAKFHGNRLLINQTDRLALTGSNLEVGYLSKCWGDWNFYLAASTYFFKNSGANTKLGGMGKFRTSYKDLISLEIDVSGDHLFGTNVNGFISLLIPLGKKGMNAVKNKRCRIYKSRPPERLEPIVLKTKTKKFIARDSLGNPINFIFVNNLSGSNGTFEDPFPTLVQAQNNSNKGDFIYVFSGDGTTTGMDSGIVLKPSQTLAGSGMALPISTSVGVITVPAFTAKSPQLTNSIGDGVTLAANCTVNGIDVIGSSGNGFFYSSSTATSTVTLSNCSAIENGGTSTLCGGFAISTGAPGNRINASFNQCSAIRNTTDGSICGGFAIVTDFLASNSAITASFNQCSANGNNDVGSSVNGGFALASGAPGSAITASFNQCLANGNNDSGADFANGGFAIASLSPNNLITVSFNQCSANGNNDSGMSFSNGGFAIANGAPNNSITVSFNQCSANGNNDSGATLSNGGFAIANGTVNNLITALFNQCSANENTSSGATLSNGGFAISSTAPDLTTISLSQCSANNNNESGFDIKTFSSGLIKEGSASGNSANSFEIDTPNAGIFTITGDTMISELKL